MFRVGGIVRLHSGFKLITETRNLDHCSLPIGTKPARQHYLASKLEQGQHLRGSTQCHSPRGIAPGAKGQPRSPPAAPWHLSGGCFSFTRLGGGRGLAAQKPAAVRAIPHFGRR